MDGGFHSSLWISIVGFLVGGTNKDLVILGDDSRAGVVRRCLVEGRRVVEGGDGLREVVWLF